MKRLKRDKHGNYKLPCYSCAHNTPMIDDPSCMTCANDAGTQFFNWIEYKDGAGYYMTADGVNPAYVGIK